jgi:Glycosyl hydrolase family 3 N terminal domain/Glycosyl hydrolase family 3 C-terminal domain
LSGWPTSIADGNTAKASTNTSMKAVTIPGAANGRVMAPVLDVVRDYRCGRVEGTLGEDPYLVAVLGTAYVRGLQSAGVVATLKHFAGYSASAGGRNHAPALVGPRELADVILPPFEMAVRAGGARSVMNSYSEIDGMPAVVDHHLLTALLRQEWGFTGTTVSDYWSIAFLKSKHRVFPGQAGGAAIADVLSGVVNPSGRLPVQIPASDGGMPHTYLAPPLGHGGDRITNLSMAPAFPFGHGLSYTSFEYADLELDTDTIAPDGELCPDPEVPR